MPVGDATAVTSPPGVLRVPGLGTEHGFTTRNGGVSSGAFTSLNLGLSSGDDRQLVEANRDRLLAHVGVERERVCAFNQVHGTNVLVGRPTWFEEDADAGITDRPDLLLVVSAADCFPVLFHDQASGAVGAAHCGWRGTEARLVAEVAKAMHREYGTAAADLRVAVGPGIRGACYQVSAPVAERFTAAGFAAAVTPDAVPGKFLLDLEAALAATFAEVGVPAGNVEWLARCTHCEPATFYSHRRDAGTTGRLWGFIRAGVGADSRGRASASGRAEA